MEKDFAKNLYYKVTQVTKKKDSGALLVGVRLQDENNNEYTWWPPINSLYEVLSALIAIQKQHKENKEELETMLKMLEGQL